jgi:hypothetical protein
MNTQEKFFSLPERVEIVNAVFALFLTTNEIKAKLLPSFLYLCMSACGCLIQLKFGNKNSRKKMVKGAEKSHSRCLNQNIALLSICLLQL